MPTLNKNQKFQLSEMNATFRTVARWSTDEAGKPLLQSSVTVFNIDNDRVLAEVTSIEEQVAIDLAIEKARESSGAQIAFVDEETRLKAKVEEQAKQLAELSALVKSKLVSEPPFETKPKK